MVNNIVLGLFSSLIAAVFLGIYPVPRKYVDFGINDYMISMTIGVFLSGFFYKHPHPSVRTRITWF